MLGGAQHLAVSHISFLYKSSFGKRALMWSRGGCLAISSLTASLLSPIIQICHFQNRFIPPLPQATIIRFLLTRARSGSLLPLPCPSPPNQEMRSSRFCLQGQRKHFYYPCKETWKSCTSRFDNRGWGGQSGFCRGGRPKVAPDGVSD